MNMKKVAGTTSMLYKIIFKIILKLLVTKVVATYSSVPTSYSYKFVANNEILIKKAIPYRI